MTVTLDPRESAERMLDLAGDGGPSELPIGAGTP